MFAFIYCESPSTFGTTTRYYISAKSIVSSFFSFILINSKFHAIKMSFKYMGQILDQSHMSKKVIFSISFCSHILAFYWNKAKSMSKTNFHSFSRIFVLHWLCTFLGPFKIELSCAVQTVKQDRHPAVVCGLRQLETLRVQGISLTKDHPILCCAVLWYNFEKTLNIGEKSTWKILNSIITSQRGVKLIYQFSSQTVRIWMLSW